MFLQDEEFEQRKQKAVRTVEDLSVSISLCLLGVNIPAFI